MPNATKPRPRALHIGPARHPISANTPRVAPTMIASPRGYAKSTASARPDALDCWSVPRTGARGQSPSTRMAKAPWPTAGAPSPSACLVDRWVLGDAAQTLGPFEGFCLVVVLALESPDVAEDVVPEVRDPGKREAGQGHPDPVLTDREVPQLPHVEVGDPGQPHTEAHREERVELRNRVDVAVADHQEGVEAESEECEDCKDVHSSSPLLASSCCCPSVGSYSCEPTGAHRLS